MANTVEIVIKSSQQGNAFRNTRDQMGKTEKSAGRLRGALANVGTVAAGMFAANAIQAGFGALTGFLDESIDLAKEQARVESQLNAVIASTGGAAGISAKEIKEMASSFQEVTNFGDEATIASSNVLLTFTKIGGDVFPRAQKAILDVSAAMGQDLQSSTVQIGKALNDPTKGLSALTRVGITFTDQQKEQIKAMQAAGDVAGAQAVILSELETQFKGSAEAAVEADEGITQAENAIGDLQEQIGQKMIPIMAKFKQAQLAVVAAVVDRVIPAFERMAPILRGLWEAAKPVIRFVFEPFLSLLPRVQTLFDETRAKVMVFVDGLKGIGTSLNPESTIGKFNAFGLKVKELAGRLKTFFDETRAKVRSFIDGLKGIGTSLNPESTIGKLNALGLRIREFADLIRTEVVPRVVAGVAKLGDVWDAIKPQVMQAVSTIGEIILALAELVVAVLTQTTRAALYVWDNWGDEIVAVVKWVWGIVAPVIQGALEIILGLIRTVTAVIQGDWSGAWEGVKQILSGAWRAILGILQGALSGLIVLARNQWALFMQLFTLNPVVQAIRSAASNIVETIRRLHGRIRSAAANIWDGLFDPFKKVIDKIKNLWNKLDFKVPEIDVPVLGRVGGSKIRLPSIRSLGFRETGGIAGGLTVVGEKGAELVNLPAGSMVRSAPDTQRDLARMGGGRGGVPIVVNVAGSVISERDLVSVLRDELLRGGLADAFAR